MCDFYDKEYHICRSKELSISGKVQECKEGFIKWLSQEAKEDKTKTADEMFEKLGYDKQTFDEFGANEIIYINNNKDNIIVKKNGYYIKYNYYDFHPDYDYNDINFITEAEDKAIHKKIEELKGKREDK